MNKSFLTSSRKYLLDSSKCLFLDECWDVVPWQLLAGHGELHNLSVSWLRVLYKLLGCLEFGVCQKVTYFTNNSATEGHRQWSNWCFSLFPRPKKPLFGGLMLYLRLHRWLVGAASDRIGGSTLPPVSSVGKHSTWHVNNHLCFVLFCFVIGG